MMHNITMCMIVCKKFSIYEKKYNYNYIYMHAGAKGVSEQRKLIPCSQLYTNIMEIVNYTNWLLRVICS